MLISGERVQEPGGERRVDSFEEFEKEQTDSITRRQEQVTSGVRKLLDEALGTQLRELVAERGEAIVFGRRREGGRGSRVQLRGGERALSGDRGEPDQGMHQRELPRVVQLQAGDAFAIWQNGGLTELSKLPAIDEGFEDVLLDIQVAVDDGSQLRAQLGKIVDGLRDRV